MPKVKINITWDINAEGKIIGNTSSTTKPKHILYYHHTVDTIPLHK